MPRPQTLREIANYLKRNKILGLSTIVIKPPSDPSASDEESGPEEGRTIDDMPRSLTHTAAYLVEYGDGTKPDTDHSSSSTEDDSSDDESPPSLKSKRRKTTNDHREWKKVDIDVKPVLGRMVTQSIPFFNQLRSPTEIFELFLDDDIIGFIVRNSNENAARNGVQLGLTNNEFKRFLGIIFVSGYVSHPRRAMFWERDSYNTLVFNAMSYQRFETILHNLYVTNNSYRPLPNDRFCIVRPLITKLNERCMKFVPNETHFNFDEIRVPYYGRLGDRKLNNEGMTVHLYFKFSCAATTHGYVCWFEPYQHDMYQKLDVDDLPVVKFSEALTKAYPGKYHYVLDVLTHTEVLNKLRSMGHQVTGGVYERCPEMKSLESVFNLGTGEIGSFDYRTDEKGNLFCRWKGNNIITVASSGAGIQPLHPVDFFYEKEKKTIQTQQPDLIKVYYQFRGRVSKVDENIEKCRAFITGKKWYLKPLMFFFELMLQNSWQLHRIHGKQEMDLLEFRRRITREYLKAPGQRR